MNLLYATDVKFSILSGIFSGNSGVIPEKGRISP